MSVGVAGGRAYGVAISDGSRGRSGGEGGRVAVRAAMTSLMTAGGDSMCTSSQ